MSREFYPEIVFDDTFDPADFEDVDDAVQAVADACDGFGTDEEALIECLASKTPEERFKIYYRYEALREENLARRIDRETSGHFGLALELLAYPPDLAEARMIKLACKGGGTDERLLYSIMLGRSNREIEQLRKAFFKLYEEDLGNYLSGELSGTFERVIFQALQGLEKEYDPEYHTEEQAAEDAQAFYKAGEGKWGTDETEMFRILCECPPEHLMTMQEIYNGEHGHDMFRALAKELTGTLDDASFYFLGIKTNPADHAATLIKKACKGFGTDDDLLMSCLIRYHQILPQVSGAHEALFDKTLLERVDSETSGNYGALLCKLVENNS